MDEQVVLHRNADPIKVKLIKGQKESYGWEITIQGNTEDSILGKIDGIDFKLREKYIKEE